MNEKAKGRTIPVGTHRVIYDMTRSSRIFLALSLLILILDLTFVGINYYLARSALEESIREQGRQRHTAFNIALSLTYDNMLQLATYVANQPEVQDTFLAAVRTITAAGGDPEAPQVVLMRRKLLGLVKPSWEIMTQKFNVRQLHFHLGPGSTSFLRVHRPEHYGDNMDQVRFTVVDTNREHNPHTGFETGRIYSGLRGVVPVSALDPDSGETVHVGALEAGTSFSTILDLLRRYLGCEIAVLLTEEHVKSSMWPEFVARHFIANKGPFNCFLEATTSDEINAFIQRPDLVTPRSGLATDLVRVGDRDLAVTRFPLRDYKGDRDPERKQCGGVFLWWDASEEVATFHRGQTVNILYAVGGFGLVELFLFLAIRLVTRHLEMEVAERTATVRHLNQALYAQSITDALTGLYNRRHFLRRLQEEIDRAVRYDKPLALLMVDLDHFKTINDRYGHAAGDTALVVVANTIEDTARKSDICCRYGGEELAVLLPETDEREALSLAKRLRRDIAGAIIEHDGQRLSVTASIGVAVRRPDSSGEQLIAAADTALYRAKRAGRDRVKVFKSSTDG